MDVKCNNDDYIVIIIILNRARAKRRCMETLLLYLYMIRKICLSTRRMALIRRRRPRPWYTIIASMYRYPRVGVYVIISYKT